MGLLGLPMPGCERIRLIEREACRDGTFARRKTSKMRPAAVGARASSPFTQFRVPINTCSPAAIVRPQAGIAAVFVEGGVSQISESIIGPNAVYVVDNTFWPNPELNGPCDPVCLVNVVVNAADPIAFFRHCGECFRPDVSRVPTWSGIRPVKPIKLSRFRFITKQFATQFGCDNRLNSHSVLPHVCGQGRARVQPRLRPVFYTKICRERQARWLRRNREVTAAALGMGK